MPNDILKTYLEAKKSGASEQNAIAAVRQNSTAAASASQNTQTQAPASGNTALNYLMAKRQGMSEKEALATVRSGVSAVSTPGTQSRLYDDKSNKQTLLEKARSSTADSAIGNALANRRLERLTKKYGNQVFDDNFLGQFRANYGAGKISQEYALAYSDYMDNPTKENYDYAVAMRNLYNQMVANNQEALDDQNVSAGWLTKDIAGYLPQLGNQLKTSLPYAAAGIISGAKSGAAAGAAAGGVVGEVVTPIPVLDGLLGGGAGAVVGGIAGAIGSPLTKAGLTVGSGVYSYDTMRGMAFANLVDLGVDEAKAKEAANDEALISSAIEMGDTAFDLFTKIPGISGTLKNLSEKTSKTAIQRLVKELASYGFNVGQEYGEEYIQEIISMANERRVARGEYDTGITGLVNECIALAKDMHAGNAEAEKAQAQEAGKGGAVIGAVMGAGRTGVGKIVNRMNETTIRENLNKVIDNPELANETDENLTRLRDLADNKATRNEAASAAIQKEQARREEVRQKQEEQAKHTADLNNRLNTVTPETLRGLTDEELNRARTIAERLQNYAAVDKIDDEIYRREEETRTQARQQQEQQQQQQEQAPAQEQPSQADSMAEAILRQIQQRQQGQEETQAEVQATMPQPQQQSQPQPTQAEQILQQIRGEQIQEQAQEQAEELPIWEQDQQTELTEEQRAAWEESRQLADEINQTFDDIYNSFGQEETDGREGNPGARSNDTHGSYAAESERRTDNTVEALSGADVGGLLQSANRQNAINSNEDISNPIVSDSAKAGTVNRVGKQHVTAYDGGQIVAFADYAEYGNYAEIVYNTDDDTVRARFNINDFGGFNSNNKTLYLQIEENGRVLTGDEYKQFMLAHPDFEDVVKYFAPMFDGFVLVTDGQTGGAILTKYNNRTKAGKVGGLSRWERYANGNIKTAIITSIKSAPHEISHIIKVVLDSNGRGADYLRTMSSSKFIPPIFRMLVEDYLLQAYPNEAISGGGVSALEDELVAHVIQGRDFSIGIKVGDNDTMTTAIINALEIKDPVGTYIVINFNTADIASRMINSQEFRGFLGEFSGLRGQADTYADNLVNAYRAMNNYARGVSAVKSVSVGYPATASGISAIDSQRARRQKVDDALKSTRKQIGNAQSSPDYNQSNFVTSEQNDGIETQDGEVEQKPASRPTDEELNELYGERMREQEWQEEAPPHTDEDIPRSETEFDDGRPVPQKAPRETKPWEAYHDADEYAKAREAEQGEEETDAQRRQRTKKQLHEMYGAQYQDVVYGAKRMEKQKFYFEDKNSVDTTSPGYANAVKGAAKFREQVNALSEGRITMEQFADYYLSMAHDDAMAEFYSERVAERMRAVKAAADRLAESPNPAHVLSYRHASSNAVKSLETNLSQTNTARRQMLEIASQLVKHASKSKSGKIGKAAKEAAAFYTRWQISPGNVFRMIDGFNKTENGIGYQLQKEIDKATAKHQKTIAKAQMQFLKLRDMKGYAEFANGTSRSNVDVAGADLSQQEAAHLIRLIDTLKATGPDRLGSIYGFARQQKDGEYEFLELKDIVEDKDPDLELSKLRDRLYASLDDVAKAYLDISAEVLDELGTENTAVETAVNGVTPRQYKKGQYIPVHYGSKQDYRSAATTDPVQFSAMEERSRTAGGYVRLQPISMAVDSYINQSANHIAYAELGRKLELMNSKSAVTPSLSELMGEHFSDQYAKWMDNYVEDLTDFHQADKNDGINSLLGKGRRALQTGALWGSVSVPMKQISSYWSAMGVLSPEAVVRAYRSKFVKAKGSAALNLLLEYRRLGNIDPTVSDVLKADFLAKLMNKSKVMSAIGNAISAMDVRTADNLYAATVLDTKLKNPDMDVNSQEFFNAVEEKFEEVVINTQPIYTKNARAEYARTDNELIKIMSMFRTQQTQNFNRLITTIGEYKASKNKATGILNQVTLENTIKGQAIASLSLALLSIAADWILHKQKKYEDDEGDLDLEKLFDRFAMNAVESASGTAWFGDQAAKWLIDQMSEGETNEFYGLSLGPINTIQTLMERIGYFVDSPTLSNARYVAGYMAQLFGIPLNNAYQFLNSAVMYTADAAGQNKRNYDDVLKMLDKEAVAAGWKSDNANANILLNAYLSGNSRKENRVFELLGGEDSKSALKSAAKSAYVDGTMDRDQARSFLEKYLFPEEKEEAAELLEEWQMQRDTGIAYDQMGDAYQDGRLSRGDVIEYRMTYGGESREEAENYVAKQEFKKQYGVSYNDMKELYRSGGISREDAIRWRIMCGSSEESATGWADAQDVYLETGYEYTSSGSTSYMDSYSTKERLGTNSFYAKYGDQFKTPTDFGKVFNALNDASDNDYAPLYYMYKGEESELSNKQRGVVYLLNGFINDGTITRELADRIWSEYFGYSTWSGGAYQFLGNAKIA